MSIHSKKLLVKAHQDLRDAKNQILLLEQDKAEFERDLRAERDFDVMHVAKSLTWYVSVTEVVRLVKELAKRRQGIATVGSTKEAMKALDDLIRESRRL